MKKLLLLLITIFFSGCANTDRDVYTFEVELLDGTIDTIVCTRMYNKDLKTLENDVVNSSLFNESSLESALELSQTHPLGIMYKDTIQKLLPELIAFADVSKNYDNPLDEKLINNSIVFNRSKVVPAHVGYIKSFKVLSINDQEKPIIPVLEFLNNSSVSLQEIDAIPYVVPKAAKNIIDARPIKSLEELDALPYVGVKAMQRMKIYAIEWIKNK